MGPGKYRHGTALPGRRNRLVPGGACWLAALLLSAVFSAVSLPALAGDAEDALEWAAHDFRSYCAPCHGLDAKGEGPVAEVLKTRPADLTLIRRDNGGTFPSDLLHKKIEGLDMPQAHGTSEMPVWGMWFSHQAVGESILMGDAKPAAEKVRIRIRAIVDYIETLQR